MISQMPLLLVEDNEDDAFLMKRSFKIAGVDQPFYVVEDGQQAIDYLAGRGPYADRVTYPLPAFIFLDLKLPFKSGHEVLAWIRNQRELSEIVMIVLSSSNQPSDLEEAYRLGANSYVVKPPATEELVRLAVAFKHYWLDFNRTSVG
jgi:CheY-like chemotaxis protein